MSVNSELAASFRSKYEDLCRELNMDRETEDIAWKMFVEVLQRSTLEGDSLHWFCCTLYAACRLSYTPTVGESNTIVMGNCISLNKMLRCCNISISDFISKIKVWHDLANLPFSFRRQIERLERTPGITFHLYCRYNDVFEKLFVSTRYDKKNTKYRSVARCSVSKLYDLCWCLYLCAKNEEPSYNMDIVTSFHLLLCCIDLIYINVLSENRLDLVNPGFGGIPENWGSKGFDCQQIQNHSVIGDLCALTGALPSDARDMKGQHCKAIFKKFFQTKTIHGNEETFLGIISNVNFERNVKSLNSAYEQYILSVGEFDERILLNNPNYRRLSTSDMGEETHSLSTPQTPYTRMHSLPSREGYTEPVTSATSNVKKLKDIADISGPSDFIRKAGVEPLKMIYEKLAQMQVYFTAAISNSETASRFQMAKSLFFYLLDKILRVETRTKPNIDLKILMVTEPFLMTLIACCVEIVLSAYQSQMKFPWVLECFRLTPFHFHKIIEIVVRSHGGVLSRQLIKHLNCIEESCLESLAWNRQSPLWDIIKTYGLPTWSDVDVDNLEKRNLPQNGAPPQYRDIIYFYNNIYVKKLTPYALNFSGKKTSQQEVPLSPHPTEKQTYPRKLSSNLIVVSRMDKSEHSHSPVLTYEFSKSPGKNLEDLNNVISRGKRNLPFNDLDVTDETIIESKIAKKTPVFLQKCREILQDRQEQN
ncbi:retinoblastoma family protein isoform X2 [Eurosta solidaginis]|uniref:retinoblastoma family protein isoform X2 n=1 Tax=Eurosta solidaginis TaxID=178769 RepID=UPI003531534E